VPWPTRGPAGSPVPVRRDSGKEAVEIGYQHALGWRALRFQEGVERLQIDVVDRKRVSKCLGDLYDTSSRGVSSWHAVTPMTASKPVPSTQDSFHSPIAIRRLANQIIFREGCPPLRLAPSDSRGGRTCRSTPQ
jgi:hypothetical protein